MEGNLQLIYVLLTDCYVYLIRKGISSQQPLGSVAGRKALSVACPWIRPSLPSLPVPLSPVVTVGSSDGLVPLGTLGHVFVLPGTWLSLQVHCCCCRGGPVPPFTWLSVSVPGAAEKPYMVEEAVSYNELDYISVSPAGMSSPGELEENGGISSHLSRGESARSITVGCVCVHGECSGQ